MRKKRQHIDRLKRQNGYYWLRLYIPLRGGHYHHSWEIARVMDDRVQIFGSEASVPLNAPLIQNALWHGPVTPPPLEEPPHTELAVAQVRNSLNRRPGQWETANGNEPCAMARAVADGIVDAFVESVDSFKAYYGEHAEQRIELVEQVAGLIQRVIR